MAAIVFLLSPLSAFASTTESMMMYSVMPLAVVDSDDYTVSYARGFYSRETDSFDLSSYNSKFSATYSSTYTPYGSYPALAIKITGSDLGSIGDTLSIFDDTLQLRFYNDYGLDTQVRYIVQKNSVTPIKSFAEFKYSGTAQIGNTHSSGWTASTLASIPFPFTPSDLTPNSRFNLQMNSVITLPDVGSLESWKRSGTSNVPERVYDTKLTSITLYFVFNLNSNWICDTGDGVSWTVPDTDSPIAFYTYRATNCFILNLDSVGDNSNEAINNLGSMLQNSISNVSTTVANQITQVKTQLTNSTTTITNKVESVGTAISNEIDTMSTAIQSGLSDVKTSITTQTTQLKTSITNLGTTINNKLETVKTAVVEKVTEVKDSVVEVKDSILDLPNKIQEMLLGLIVPDSDTMASKYSEFSGLLEEKLGVIYQIPMMLFDFFDTIVNAATTPQTSLTLPAFTLPWIDGSTLTIWQPIEYKIIPDGMEVLSDLIQTVTSMTVVVLTFNSVKRAYERFLRS